jgi:hypothetical protein
MTLLEASGLSGSSGDAKLAFHELSDEQSLRAHCVTWTLDGKRMLYVVAGGDDEDATHHCTATGFTFLAHERSLSPLKRGAQLRISALNRSHQGHSTSTCIVCNEASKPSGRQDSAAACQAQQLANAMWLLWVRATTVSSLPRFWHVRACRCAS